LDKNDPQNDPHGNLVLVSDTTIDPVQSGGRKKLGETLTDQGIISKQELSIGLQAQKTLRKKRVGEHQEKIKRKNDIFLGKTPPFG
jgi:hypothetical protein